jgi:hypothetical protein
LPLLAIALASTCVSLIRQDRSAWSHGLDMRLDVEHHSAAG